MTPAAGALFTSAAISSADRGSASSATVGSVLPQPASFTFRVTVDIALRYAPALLARGDDPETSGSERPGRLRTDSHTPSDAAAAASRSGDGCPYVVVRWRSRLPIGATIWASWLIVLNEPFCDPAIRLIVSSMSVPPRSLTPPTSTSRHRSSPSLTHEHWIEPIAPCSISRASA